MRCVLIPALAILATACAQPASSPEGSSGRIVDDAVLNEVAASRIAVISDGDFLASTYADQVLAPAGQHEDLLTLFTVRDGQVTRTTAPVTNSVTAAPEILAVGADGRTFYVVDRLGRADASARTTPDLAPGVTLSVLRTQDDGSLALLATRAVPPSSEALAVSPDGRWLALVSNDPEDGRVTLAPLLSDGRPSEPRIFSARQLGLTGTGAGARGGLMLTNVQWSPDGTRLAVNDTGGGRVAFYTVTGGDRPGLEPWGPPVASGVDPFVGRFTPDGRYYLTSEWGRDFSATGLEGRIPETRGLLGVTALAQDGRHRRIGQVETDNSPEGIAISPDGRLVATVNMRGTAFAPSSPRFTRKATVTLLTFDPATGGLTKVEDVAFDGVLPEGATFDAEGGHLLVTVFQGHAGSQAQSGIEVFRIGWTGSTPRLVARGRVATPHGAHHVVVAP